MIGTGPDSWTIQTVTTVEDVRLCSVGIKQAKILSWKLHPEMIIETLECNELYRFSNFWGSGESFFHGNYSFRESISKGESQIQLEIHVLSDRLSDCRQASLASEGLGRKPERMDRSAGMPQARKIFMQLGLPGKA